MKKLSRRRNMFDVLKAVRDVATTENCNRVINACGRAVSTVLLPSQSTKVESVNVSKLKTFSKCDSSYLFSLYVDKPKNGIYYIIYVPRMLNVLRTKERQKAELLRDQLNNRKALMNALEEVNSKSFMIQLEHIRDSVQQNPDFYDIHHAASCNYPRVIIRLCENNSSLVNEQSACGKYPLHIAAEKNAKQAVQVLLSLGALTANQDRQLRNAVHYAAQNSSEVLELLLNAPDFMDAIDSIDGDGLSPLCLAVSSANVKCVEILLNANCSIGPFPGGSLLTIMTEAIPSPDMPRILDLLVMNSPKFLAEKIDGSSTVLHQRIEMKLLYHIMELVGDMLNIDARDLTGRTPLFCAVLRNDLSQSIALLSFNADVSIADCNGDTPLHIAAKNQNVKLFKLLLCFGASLFLKNVQGVAPIDIGERSFVVMDCLRQFLCDETPSHHPSINNSLSESMQEKALEVRHQMTPENKRKLVNVMSLDGGGIRGLVILQTLLHIENLLGRSVMDYFHWLGGTSTGAIVALALAKGYSLRRCQRLYLQMKDEIFVGERPYSEKLIEHIFKQNFGEGATMAQLTHRKVVVFASSVQTNPPELKLFRNYTLPLSKAENKMLGFDDPSKNLIWKCARYTSAAPTYFTPKDNFVDGGLMSNNPTLDLMSDVHFYNAACLKAKKEPVQIGCILSLGTGQAPIEVIKSLKLNFDLPRNVSEVKSAIRDLMITASNGACVVRGRCWAHEKSIPFFRFSPNLSSNVELDETNDEIIVDLLWDTEKYLRGEGRRDIETLVDYLKSL
ncbi:unnamed protein product [Thelazia callipaeda]|uniref:phospholipase A2 n=1 Tax=Thelazia callipaeda TaxID=103827 RepID=A0A158RBH4_THECL|nr:unnamed protein product [Thelazia callipaeda]